MAPSRCIRISDRGLGASRPTDARSPGTSKRAADSYPPHSVTFCYLSPGNGHGSRTFPIDPFAAIGFRTAARSFKCCRRGRSFRTSRTNCPSAAQPSRDSLCQGRGSRARSSRRDRRSPASRRSAESVARYRNRFGEKRVLFALRPITSDSGLLTRMLSRSTSEQPCPPFSLDGNRRWVAPSQPIPVSGLTSCSSVSGWSYLRTRSDGTSTVGGVLVGSPPFGSSSCGICFRSNESTESRFLHRYRSGLGSGAQPGSKCYAAMLPLRDGGGHEACWSSPSLSRGYFAEGDDCAPSMFMLVELAEESQKRNISTRPAPKIASSPSARVGDEVDKTQLGARRSTTRDRVRGSVPIPYPYPHPGAVCGKLKALTLRSASPFPRSLSSWASPVSAAFGSPTIGLVGATPRSSE